MVVLLINCLDPSKLTSAERRQKGTSEKLKVPCPGIIKEYNSDMNGVDMHDQLKTSNEIDRKSRFRYLHFSGISGIRYLRFFFSPMDSVVVNAHVIYKKKIDLLSFKIILAESLINRFCYQKCKITAEKPKLTVELPQPLKKPDHIVQFTEKRQRCVVLWGKRMQSTSVIVNPVMFCCMSRKTEIASTCIIPLESNCTFSQYANELLNFTILFFNVFFLR